IDPAQIERAAPSMVFFGLEVEAMVDRGESAEELDAVIEASVTGRANRHCSELLPAASLSKIERAKMKDRLRVDVDADGSRAPEHVVKLLQHGARRVFRGRHPRCRQDSSVLSRKGFVAGGSNGFDRPRLQILKECRRACLLGRDSPTTVT